jgi:hypothetical protein
VAGPVGSKLAKADMKQRGFASRTQVPRLSLASEPALAAKSSTNDDRGRMSAVLMSMISRVR